MNRSKYAVPVAAVAATLLLAGCTTGGGTSTGAAGTSDAGATAISTDTIRTTIDLPATLDPAKGLSIPDYTTSRMSFDTLVRKDNDNKVIGGLATTWKESGAGEVFTLRKDATCSDGTPITASIVKDSIDYLASPKTASSATPRIFGPKGNPTVVADDVANTVTITPTEPWPDMVEGLTMAASGIICPAGLNNLEALAAGTAKGAESGPYVLAAKEHGVRYTYALRDDYKAWPEYATALPGQAAPKVIFNVISDKNATANQLLAGQLDAGFVNANSLPRFEGNKKFTLTNEPFSDFYVLFNEREGSPFADPAKRKAVAQVLDRKVFENITTLGKGQVSTQLVSDGTPCSNPEQSPVVALDPEAAKQVLTGVKIRMVGAQIVGPQGSGNVYVEEQLRAAGATVTLENLDVGGWIGKVFGEPSAWDLTIYADLNFTGTMASPLNRFIGASVQDGGGNIGANSSPAAEKSMQAFLKAPEAERCGHLQDAMNSVVSEATAIPLITDPRLVMAADGFSVVSHGGALDDQQLRITK